MKTIPSDIAISIEKAGWVPGKRINEGGGGTVFACFSKRYIELFSRVIEKSGPRVYGPGESSSEFATSLCNSFISSEFSNIPLVGAVKIPHAVAAVEIDKRLKAEIDAMASFSHPNLIRLLSHDSEVPPRWFVMDFYRKGTLEQNGTVYKGNVLKSLQALRPLVEGVSRLHRHKPIHIHRDIKPKNIFVADDGQLVLGDFGIVFTKAEDRTRLTMPGDAAYSRDWIPEWVRHRTPEEFSPKVDVYMLAKVLYYMLANKNVIPSQLDDKDFDLRELFRNSEGVDLIYDLLISCIVSKEAQCQPSDATAFLTKIDSLISVITNRNSSLVFNYYSVNSASGIALPQDFGLGVKQLTDIQVYLSAPARAFTGKARVWGSAHMSAAEIWFAIDGEESERVRVGAPETEPGTWSLEMTLICKKTLAPGWHTLSLKGNYVYRQSVLTAFQIYAV